MEILNDLIEKQERLEKRFEAIEELLKKTLNRPTPTVTADSKVISQEIKNHIGDPSIKLKEVENNINRVVDRIPTSIRIEGYFLGFSSQKSAILFLVIFGLCCGMLGAIAYYQKTEADYNRKLAESYEADYQKVFQSDKKLAERYKKATQKK